MEATAPIRGFRTPQAAELSEMARSLAVIATLAMDYPNAAKQVSQGFREMAGLAQACGEARVCMAARALSTVLNRLDKAPEGDAPFILDTIINFLENIQGAYAWRSPAGAV